MPRTASIDDDTEHLLQRTGSTTSYGATTHDRESRDMSFLSHDHAYEHPHHGATSSEGNGQLGVQRPIPVVRSASNRAYPTLLMPMSLTLTDYSSSTRRRRRQSSFDPSSCCIPHGQYPIHHLHPSDATGALPYGSPPAGIPPPKQPPGARILPRE